MSPLNHYSLIFFLLLTGFIYGIFIIALEWRNWNSRNPVIAKPKSFLQYQRSGIILVIFLLLCFYLDWIGIGNIHLNNSICLILQFIGIILYFITLLWASWCLKVMGENFSVQIVIHEKQRVVDKGPYSIIRHPMYLAVMSVIFSFSLIFQNYFFLVYLVGIGIFDYQRAKKEEDLLIHYLGDSYRIYQHKVPMFLPFSKP